MLIQSDFPLQSRNTLAVTARAEFFSEVATLAQLREALLWADARQLPVWILGGGSNVICAPVIQGLVICPRFLGKAIIDERGDQVLVEFAAGENWHEAVTWTLENHLFGLENLALIPGTAGAAPIQNIGAYGVELSDCLDHVKAFNRRSGKVEVLTHKACELGYRDSIFKRGLRDSHIITALVVRLSRTARPVTTYPALISALGTLAPTPFNVFDTVCQVRRSKLPDPLELPNCGSFFKNPVVSVGLFVELQEHHPAMPHYPSHGEGIKLAAAWLIEQAGWRGRNCDGVVMHAQQALVLTNPQRQDAAKVLAIAKAIQGDVERKFHLTLEIEPQMLGKIPIYDQDAELLTQ